MPRLYSQTLFERTKKNQLRAFQRIKDLANNRKHDIALKIHKLPSRFRNVSAHCHREQRGIRIINPRKAKKILIYKRIICWLYSWKRFAFCESWEMAIKWFREGRNSMTSEGALARFRKTSHCKRSLKQWTHLFVLSKSVQAFRSSFENRKTSAFVRHASSFSFLRNSIWINLFTNSSHSLATMIFKLKSFVLKKEKLFRSKGKKKNSTRKRIATNFFKLFEDAHKMKTFVVDIEEEGKIIQRRTLNAKKMLWIVGT